MGAKPRVRAVSGEFPFVGAGDAEYFEWAEVKVLFSRSPGVDERAAIAAGVPVPLADSVDFDGRHLVVASAQGVGRVIEAAYGPEPRQPTTLTTTSRFKMASAARVRRFNRDIERWLRQAHQIVPIALAFRRQDAEAGGTELSQWHHDSVAPARALLAELGDSGRDADLERALVLELPPEQPTVSPSEQADTVYRLLINVNGERAELRARTEALIEQLEHPEALWELADTTADYVVCFRGYKKLAIPEFRALLMEVFRRALTGTRAADHAAAFQFRIDAGYQPWRLPRLLAVAAETALREGDREAFAHFAGGLDVRDAQQQKELARCIEALDDEGLGRLSEQLRALLP